MYKAGIKYYNRGYGNKGLIERCMFGSYNLNNNVQRLDDITDENNCVSLYLRITEKCDMILSPEFLQNAIDMCTKGGMKRGGMPDESIFWEYAPAFKKLVQDYVKRNDIKLPQKPQNKWQRKRW